MALIVFLRGVNVGGYRTFRPAALARELAHFDVVNIGAAGTFVIRRPVSRTHLRAELMRLLPFDAQITICEQQEIARLVAGNHFAGRRLRPDMVRFVSVLPHVPRSAPSVPISLPPRGQWLVKVLAREDRFLVGVYRRHMRTIGCLGSLDKIFGGPVTTRNWNTISAIAKATIRDLGTRA
jgi:uncharacterized protein (DUF1697 family)